MIGRRIGNGRVGGDLCRVFLNKLTTGIYKDSGFGVCDLFDAVALTVVVILAYGISVRILYLGLLVITVENERPGL